MKKSMMKKLVVLLAVMVVSGGFAFGATSAEVDITGEVAAFLSIEASSATAALGLLDPGVAAATAVNLTEKSNNYGGYVVEVSSANGGALRLLDDQDNYVNTGDTGETISYTATYAGETVTIDDTSEVEITSTTSGTTGTEGAVKAFEVTATASEDNYAGSYKDDLTFTITAN